MDEILKVINTWLEIEKKALHEMKGFPIVEAYHRGAVSYLTKVGLLLQRHLTSQSSRPDEAGCNCGPFYLNQGTHNSMCPLYNKSGG